MFERFTEPARQAVVLAQEQPAATKALELSADESRKLGHRLIGTEHVLLGLVSGRDRSLVRVLAEVGTDPAEVHGDVIAAFSGRAPD